MMQRKYWLCCQVYLLLAGAFVFSPAEAQNSSSRQHKWSVGERVEVYVVEPHSPTGKMIWRPGVITEVFGWGGAHVRFDNGDVESIGAYNPDADGANPPNLAARPVDSTSGATSGATSAPMTAPTTAPTSAPHPDKAPPTPQNKPQDCACDPGIRDNPKPGAPLSQLFKHLILENYEAEVNGSTTAPLKVGVTFQQFQIGAPQKNRVTRYGVEYPSAPIGAVIYPVTTKHTLCRFYKGGPTQTLFEGHYACFKDKTGHWVCPTAPGHKILGYK